MSKSIFQNIQDPNERLDAIKGIAVLQEKAVVKRDYSIEEIEQKRIQLANINVELLELEEKKAKLLAEIKPEMKQYKADHAGIVKDIRRGHEQFTTEVFGIDDQENGVMNFYDGMGNFVNSRPLMASERQTQIRIFEKRTGTNN